MRCTERDAFDRAWGSDPGNGKNQFYFLRGVIGRNWSREIKRKAGILANETKQRRGSGSVSLKVNSLIF